MVICDSIGKSSSSKRPAPSSRRFFDRWSEYEAHEFTFRILGALGFEDAVKETWDSSNTSASHMSFFSRLRDPTYHSESSIPFNLIQARALFQKNDDFDSGLDKEAAAFSSWLRSEQQCSDTNVRWSENRLSKESESVGHYARAFIARVLGPAPTLEQLDLRFGPGATTSCTNKTAARWKLSAPRSASNALFRLQSELSATIPGWLGSNAWVPTVGALAFVPKNFKTFRSIDIQPSLNSLVQKGIGTYMKQRLLLAGINLYDQTINQKRALEGSRMNNLVTIDLERASDTLSYLTVMNLLPWDWFNLLDAARTAHTSYKGKLYSLSKFSAMGCGFTFELESLIFASLCRGLEELYSLPYATTVYGDDIITSRDVGEKLDRVFQDYGFSINKEKSFFDGPFRESCGADYAFGVDVRPFFLRGLRDGGRWTYAKCVSFHNFLQRKPWFDPDRKVRHILVSAIPEKYRNWGPDGYGDGFLVSHAPVSSYLERPKKLLKKGFEGYLVKSVIALPTIDLSDCEGDRYLPAYLAGQNSDGTHYQLRTSKEERIRERIVDMYIV